MTSEQIAQQLQEGIYLEDQNLLLNWGESFPELPKQTKAEVKEVAMRRSAVSAEVDAEIELSWGKQKLLNGLELDIYTTYPLYPTSDDRLNYVEALLGMDELAFEQFDLIRDHLWQLLGDFEEEAVNDDGARYTLWEVGEVRVLLLVQTSELPFMTPLSSGFHSAILKICTAARFEADYPDGEIIETPKYIQETHYSSLYRGENGTLYYWKAWDADEFKGFMLYEGKLGEEGELSKRPLEEGETMEEVLAELETLKELDGYLPAKREWFARLVLMVRGVFKQKHVEKYEEALKNGLFWTGNGFYIDYYYRQDRSYFFMDVLDVEVAMQLLLEDTFGHVAKPTLEQVLRIAVHQGEDEFELLFPEIQGMRFVHWTE